MWVGGEGGVGGCIWEVGIFWRVFGKFGSIWLDVGVVVVGVCD